MLLVLICAVHLTVCSYHVTYVFQSESALYSCLNVKELLAQSRSEIWSLSDSNWTQRSGRKMNKRKNLLILHYFGKGFPSFSMNRKKKVFQAFSLQLCSTANSKFSFNVSLNKINCFKTQTIFPVPKSIHFSRDSLCFIYFGIIIGQQLKKSSSWLNLQPF